MLAGNFLVSATICPRISQDKEAAQALHVIAAIRIVANAVINLVLVFIARLTHWLSSHIIGKDVAPALSRRGAD